MQANESPIDLLDPNDVGALLASIVGDDRTVLYVGRGQWALAEALVDRQCRVSGVDARPAGPHEAPAVLESLVVADLDCQPLSTHVEPESFDVVVLDEVLADLRDPVAALRDAAGVLVAGGRILTSVHNAAHGSARLALLQGRASTSPERQPGVSSLHRTFTHDSLCSLLEKADLSVESLHATLRDPLDAGVVLDPDRLPALVVEWVRHQPDALHHCYVAVAHPATGSPATDVRPRIRSVVPAATVRLTDEHTHRMRADQQERHRMLTMRDHVLGLEASGVSAQVRVAQATARQRTADRRTKQLRAELDALTSAIERMATSPVRPSRAALRRLFDLAREGSRGSDPGP
jgi:2-polyprenyl-3-methyl-5-hydroxy-6-metoxy-1,4-benzoquinol methylase